jgi:hypothetical protein
MKRAMSIGHLLLLYVVLSASIATTVAQEQPSTTSNTIQFEDVMYNDVTVLSGINQHTVDIFNRGQAMGNRAHVFSKVGDSITEAPWFLNPLGRNLYELGEYDHLQAAIDHFSVEIADDNNSFLHDSVAMASGWNARLMQDPDYADPTLCYIGETPLECEYRTIRPAIALIMFGTNDVGYMDQYFFRDNMAWIIQTSIDYGVIPVISTIPNRLDVSERVPTFNAVIRNLAQQYDIPLWDYKAVLDTLPNEGLSTDGVHPNTSPHSMIGQADFTGENLQYGYPMRNLTALQVLHGLLEQVILRTATT